MSSFSPVTGTPDGKCELSSMLGMRGSMPEVGNRVSPNCRSLPAAVRDRLPSMSDRMTRPVWLFLAAVLIGLPALYVASFGPACWLVSRRGVGAQALRTVYRPVFSACQVPPTIVAKPMGFWSRLGAKPGWRLVIEKRWDSSGRSTQEIIWLDVSRP